MSDKFSQMHNDYLDPDRYNSGQDTEGQHGEVSIDLKWSLWTTDQGIWEEKAPEAIKMLHMMLNNTLVIHTAPRKEIRYGTVTITGTSECSDAKGALKATGRFVEYWDSVDDLMGALDMPETEYARESLAECLPFVDFDSPGVAREFTVEAESVAELLAKIDTEEDALIEDSAKQFSEVESLFKKAKPTPKKSTKRGSRERRR